MQVRHALCSAIGIHRFPFFCATLVGGATLFQKPIIDVLLKAGLGKRTENARRIATFAAALIAAVVSFALLNSGTAPCSRPLALESATDAPLSSTNRDAEEHQTSQDNTNTSKRFGTRARRDSQVQDGSQVEISTLPRELIAGRSIDLTLFVFVRALDTLFPTSSSSTRSKSRFIRPAVPWSTIFFTLSCATIMHAWFYSPGRLPRTYNAWISRAAQLDWRVTEVLRRCRRGEFVYGRETGQADLLGSVSEEEGIPYELGDPAKTIPVSCEIVNRSILVSPGLSKTSRWRRLLERSLQGSCGCERHALLRFMQGWLFAALMYFPLQFLVLAKRMYEIRRPRNDRVRTAVNETLRAILAASRSASFLGAFIALTYYGVCLGRTRIGPKLLTALTKMPSLGLLFGDGATGKAMDKAERHRVVSQMLDGGLAPTLGCFLCGLSILIEEPRRRVEIMLFVAPRAVGAWVPRRYHRKVCSRNTYKKNPKKTRY